MRNITDEQAESVAIDIVIDHLLEGVEYMTIVGFLNDSFADEDSDAEDDDYEAVQDATTRILATLRSQLEAKNQ